MSLIVILQLTYETTKISLFHLAKLSLPILRKANQSMFIVLLLSSIDKDRYSHIVGGESDAFTFNLG